MLPTRPFGSKKRLVLGRITRSLLIATKREIFQEETIRTHSCFLHIERNTQKAKTAILQNLFTVAGEIS
jgi:hypothetical protein